MCESKNIKGSKPTRTEEPHMSDQLFTKAPFISHDGPDAQGVRAEVKVYTGHSTIKEFEDGEKSLKVSFLNPKSKYLTNGYLWKRDEKLVEMFQRAQQDETPLWFRIEQPRKDGIDRSIPISELLPAGDTKAARDNSHRRVAALKINEGDEWTFSSMALTNPAEDPVVDGVYSALNYTPPASTSAPAASDRYASQRLENPPYMTLNPDGTINPGGPLVASLLSLANFLFEWNRDHDDISLNEGQVRYLSCKMLEIANRLQLMIYRGAMVKPDYSIGSHTRAKAAIYETIRNYHPITAESLKSKDSVAEWLQNVEETAGECFVWAMSVAETFHPNASHGESRSEL